MTTELRNEHYRKLNERFDARETFLFGKGFRYHRIAAMNVAVFSRTVHGKTVTIAAGTVLNADEIVWSDTIETL